MPSPNAATEMTTRMEKLYSFAENNKIMSRLCAFQRSMWYPAIFAVLTVLACSFDLDIIFIYIIMLSTVFAALFNADFKPVLVTVLFTYFTFGLHADVTQKNLSNYEVGYTTADIVQLIVCASLLVVAIVVRLAVSGELKSGIKRHAFTAGILAMCTAFCLNGLFFEGYTTNNLIMAVIETASFLPLYYIVLCGIPKGDKTLIPYLCKLCAILAGIITAELLILVIKLGAGGILLLDGAINRDFIVLGWGVNNLIGSMLVVLIPPIMYLAYKNKKFSALFIIFAAALVALIFIIQCRAALIFGALMFVGCLVICCVRGESRKVSRIAAAATLAAAVVAIIVLGASGYLERLFSHIFGGDGQSEDISNGRFAIWTLGWENFLKSPVFGVGFGESAYPEWHSNYGTSLLTQNLYHNIGMQFLAATGIVGCLAFGVHLFELVRFYIKNIRVSAEVNFMGLAALAILLLSLLDNMFFFPCFAIFYVVFLAAGEIGAAAALPGAADELV